MRYKLFYYTTFFFVCQALFRTFFEVSFPEFRSFLNFSLVRYFLLYHFFSILSRRFRDKFLLFFEFRSSELLSARSLIPKFPALFRFS